MFSVCMREKRARGMEAGKVSFFFFWRGERGGKSGFFFFVFSSSSLSSLSSSYLRRHRQKLGPRRHDLADVQRRGLLALHDDLREVVYLESF